MDKNGLFVAAMLDSASKAYAAGVATRELEEVPGLDGEKRFQELAAEAELRIGQLAESIAAGRPALFASEVAWLKVLYASRGQDWKRLELGLACLEAELLERLPASASGPVSEHVGVALRGLGQAPTELPSLLADERAPHAALARRYLLAILEGRPDEAISLALDAADSGVPIPDLHDHVILPVQVEIGRMWQMGEVHVGDEHLGTRRTEDVMTLLRMRIPAPGRGARKVLAAGAPGTIHDLGLLMAADRLRLAGWETIVLGADVPPSDCVRSAVDHGADLIAVSLPILLNLRSTFELTREMRSCTRIPVLAGGRLLVAVPDLWEVIGADAGVTTAAEAAAAAGRLVPEKA